VSKKYHIPISNFSPQPEKEFRGKFHVSKKRKLILFVIAVALIGSGIFFEFAYKDEFYPGISIGDVPVGGKTLIDVLGYFRNEEKVMQSVGLRVNFLNGEIAKTIKIPMSVTGFTADSLLEYYSLGDWKETVTQAYEFGRSGSLWRRLKEHAGIVLGKKFSLPSIPHEESIASLVSREIGNFLKKPVPAQFAFDEKGEAYILPEKNGEIIDPEEVVNVVKKKIESFDSSPVNFQVKSEAPLTTKTKLEPFLKLVQELAPQTDLFFRYKNYWWRVSGQRLSTWFMIKNENKIRIDSEKLEAFISKTIGPDINDPAQNSRFQIRDGKFKEIIPGRSGKIVDTGKIVEKVGQVISSVQKSFAATGNLASALKSIGSEINFNPKNGDINVPVEMIAQEPKITKETVDQYKIKDLVGFSKTSFKGSSEDRKTNIRVGAASLNGLLIAPGEEFSAVDAIGYVTEDAGYVKEYVIKDNKSIKELGGGLCQIGTTLFRLALNAGLPVTERVNHRYVVGYYGPGLDATIYGPHPDLRFVNDTGQYLLMQARVEGTDVVFELYGQKDGRQVVVSDPVLHDRIPPPPIKYIPNPYLSAGFEQCTETPRTGVTADVTYRVGLPNGEVREQIFTSVYQPWGRVCLIGTKI